jgi:hypothetical protein
LADVYARRKLCEPSRGRDQKENRCLSHGARSDLIVIAQRRFDEVIRELDRHRFMRKQLNSFREAPRLGAEQKLIDGTVNNEIEGATTNKKIA